MSEENKKIELKDEDLEKVSGGASISFNRFDVGDVFKQNDFWYHVVSRTAYGPFSDESRIYVRAFKMSSSNTLIPIDNLETNVSYSYLTGYTYMPHLSDPNLIQN